MQETNKIIRCTVCREEFPESYIIENQCRACPACNSTKVPQYTYLDINLKVNKRGLVNLLDDALQYNTSILNGTGSDSLHYMTNVIQNAERKEGDLIEVTLNWHELRILAIWALAWQAHEEHNGATGIHQDHSDILDELRRYRPQGLDVPALTIAEEVRELSGSILGTAKDLTENIKKTLH